jgi:hypothetical protein
MPLQIDRDLWDNKLIEYNFSTHHSSSGGHLISGSLRTMADSNVTSPHSKNSNKLDYRKALRDHTTCHKVVKNKATQPNCSDTQAYLASTVWAFLQKMIVE